jgi:hypothetical protein
MVAHWNEWRPLSAKYRDLPQSAVVAMTVWQVRAPHPHPRTPPHVSEELLCGSWWYPKTRPGRVSEHPAGRVRTPANPSARSLSAPLLGETREGCCSSQPRV